MAVIAYKCVNCQLIFVSDKKRCPRCGLSLCYCSEPKKEESEQIKGCD